MVFTEEVAVGVAKIKFVPGIKEKMTLPTFDRCRGHPIWNDDAKVLSASWPYDVEPISFREKMFLAIYRAFLQI